MVPSFCHPVRPVLSRILTFPSPQTIIPLTPAPVSLLHHPHSSITNQQSSCLSHFISYSNFKPASQARHSADHVSVSCTHTHNTMTYKMSHTHTHTHLTPTYQRVALHSKVAHSHWECRSLPGQRTKRTHVTSTRVHTSCRPVPRTPFLISGLVEHRRTLPLNHVS